MKLMTSPPHRTPIGPVNVFSLRLVRNSAIALLAVLMIIFVGPVDAAVRQSCDWSKRGENAFMLDVPSAVDVYTHIPKATREILKRRMKARDYDDFAEIRRDKVVGSSGAEYGDMRFMHFGRGEICAKIDFSRWKASDVERGPVYCESGHCIIVPTVCRNVSLITRTKAPPPPISLLIPPLSSPGDLRADLEPGEISWSGDESRFGRLSLSMLLGDPLPHALGTPVPENTPTPDGERPWGAIFAGWPFGWSTPVLWPAPSQSTAAPTVEPMPVVNPPALTFLPPADIQAQNQPPIFAQTSDKWAPSDGSFNPVAAVPEPGTWALMAFGLVIVASWARKNRNRLTTRAPPP